MRSEGYSTWSVCVSVCLLLNISLFTCLFVPQTILTFLAADEGRNFKRFSLKMLRCEAKAYMITRPFFTPRKMRMGFNLDHVASGRFVLGRGVHCEFDYWPLAVSAPPGFEALDIQSESIFVNGLPMKLWYTNNSKVIVGPNKLEVLNF